MNETHESIMTEIQTYSEENGKFVDKGVKASATRARKALANLSKLIKARRKEIQEVKNAAKTAASFSSTIINLKPSAIFGWGFFYL